MTDKLKSFWCDVGIAPYDRHRKVMLRRVTIKAHSVGVDILRRSSIKAHSVGVDAHIDPRLERKFYDSIIKSAEIIQASP